MFLKQKTAYEVSACLVGAEMGIRDRLEGAAQVVVNGVTSARLSSCQSNDKERERCFPTNEKTHLEGVLIKSTLVNSYVS